MTVQETKSLAPAVSNGAAAFFAPLQREIDRVFADFGDLTKADFLSPIPRMDFSETDQAIELTAELPGLTEKDVTVALDGDVLNISGEKRSENEESRKGYRLVERRYGSFARSVRLPEGVRTDQIKASLKDGVLTVTAPKAPGAKSRQKTIPVSAG